MHRSLDDRREQGEEVLQDSCIYLAPGEKSRLPLRAIVFEFAREMGHRRISPGPVAPSLTLPLGSNRYAVLRASPSSGRTVLPLR